MPVVLRPCVSHPKGCLLLLGSVSDLCVWVPLLFIPSATQVLSHMICVGPITSWEIDGKTVQTVSDFIFGGSKITADGD